MQDKPEPQMQDGKLPSGIGAVLAQSSFLRNAASVRENSAQNGRYDGVRHAGVRFGADFPFDFEVARFRREAAGGRRG